MFDSVEHAQAELDAWVHHYNHDRPHQSLGMRAPIDRFRLARTVTLVDSDHGDVDPTGEALAGSPAWSRWSRRPGGWWATRA